MDISGDNRTIVWREDVYSVGGVRAQVSDTYMILAVLVYVSLM